ncbi:glycosyltransferase family A protein [Vibrio lentus]|uniref:Glycosyltransferase 2-like domain-containing protein n=2 Tax=Vibrio lentus TaxID=136468 RepID=A0AA45A8C3_9VIBR|nr:glycosyltransferase family A protein [Vibrio lentus]MCB5358428.1 glycosyltransferase family 2 protein [Vibrio lentus]MCB5448896.1 glycosyltransferase family 2 protein [Vibrio lentus]MCB5460783.1 glycosyltransferase family 2 protein [Vibrio lentus]MCC4795157.1 glycosyltransferase family 2 protein [Vibrio lentus]MCC4852278.1 glycosyltransferase family 2 protein [Vibrio lentus]
MKKILVATMTTGTRQSTLLGTLTSLNIQKPSQDYIIEILLVGNTSTESDELMRFIDQTTREFNVKLNYVREATIGIPFARNCALDFATKNGFDYLCFIDDDAFANDDWIEQLANSINSSDLKAVTGPQLALFPEGTSKLYKNARIYHERKIEDGSLVKWAATNNVIFDVEFTKTHNLKFNENMRQGGSDKEFFFKFAKQGGRILWDNNAIVSEYISINRLSVNWAMKRAFRIGATGFKIESSRRNSFMTHSVCLFKGVAYLGKAMVSLLPELFSKNGSILNPLCDFSHSYGFFYGIFTRGRISSYI